MSGYIQWPDGYEFKQGDVVLNGGLFWQMDGAGGWRIIDDSEYRPVCGKCGQPKQPGILRAHQRMCERMCDKGGIHSHGS